MNVDKPAEPSAESMAEIPETDFSGAIRPNRYANLRGDFEHGRCRAQEERSARSRR